jgi:hypothetical protein
MGGAGGSYWAIRWLFYVTSHEFYVQVLFFRHSVPRFYPLTKSVDRATSAGCLVRGRSYPKPVSVGSYEVVRIEVLRLTSSLPAPPAGAPPVLGPLVQSAEGLPSTRNWPFRWPLPLPPTSSPPQVPGDTQGAFAKTNQVRAGLPAPPVVPRSWVPWCGARKGCLARTNWPFRWSLPPTSPPQVIPKAM